MATRIIAIANQKGGVAKTTTAINVAACLALAGHKTLVIDIDSQANASQGLGVFSFDHGTAELFENSKTTFKGVINPTAIPNLSIIPSDLSLSQVEWQLLKSFKQGHTTILRDKLKAEKIDFDYCVIDCPPSLGLFSLNALMVADRVVIPVGLDPFALVGIKYLTNTINEIRMSSNKTLKISGIVRTLWDLRLILAREITENLEQDYPGKLFKSIVKDSVRVRESIVAQTPIVIYEPTAPASQQYASLTEEILGQW